MIGTVTTDRNSYQRKTLRRLLLARWRPGDPCGRCGRPMYGPPSMIDLGHTVMAALGGTFADGARLEHRRCNRASGAAAGNRQRARQPRQQWRSSRQW